MTDDESIPSRKNSILVREDTLPQRGPSNAHPHFVESVTPFRSPSVTLLDGQPISQGVNAEQQQQQVPNQYIQQKLNQYHPTTRQSSGSEGIPGGVHGVSGGSAPVAHSGAASGASTPSGGANYATQTLSPLGSPSGASHPTFGAPQAAPQTSQAASQGTKMPQVLPFQPQDIPEQVPPNPNPNASPQTPGAGSQIQFPSLPTKPPGKVQIPSSALSPNASPSQDHPPINTLQLGNRSESVSAKQAPTGAAAGTAPAGATPSGAAPAGTGIASYGMPGAAATNAWLSKPTRAMSPPHESEPVVSGRATSKQPSDPRIVMDDGKIHILIGVTGSLYVSSVKQIIMKLQSIYGNRVAIQVIVTPVAEKMISNTSKHAANAPAGGAAGAAGATAPPGNAGASSTSTSAPPTGASGAPTSAPAGAPTGNPAGASSGAPAGASAGTPAGATAGAPPNASPDFRIWHDADEWDTWHGRNDPVIHIELRRWADILLIAPLSANTLGKIAMGLCDNLLTNVVRAWNAQYPILIAPAMVAYAYNHPATKQHLRIIQEEMKWIEILRPTEKVAGSTGGIGMGGMMPWNEIVAHVVQKLGGYPDEDEDDEDEDEDDDDNKTPGERLEDGDDEDEDEDEDDDNDILQETIDHDHPIARTSSPI